MSLSRSIPTTDRISALPDALICHILSFLPTKLAVATCILSKRWTPLWKSVLTLDFDDESFKDFGTFRHFVYSVIVSRHITLPLRSFRINCGKSKNFNLCDVNRFVHTAVQRGLENFDLDLSNWRFFNDQMEYLTPNVLCVFNCKTLVVLKLASLEIDDVPQSINLPLLKTLYLNSVSFPLARVHSEMFVYGCPNLENLITNIEDYPYFLDDSGDIKGFPKLVRANLSYHIDIFPFDWLHNAKFLRAELMYTYESRVPTFHNLRDMELIFHSESWEGKWKWLIQVLQHCPKLQNLTIEEAGEYEEVIEDEDWKDPKTIPECLLSQLRTCCLRCFNGYQCELQFAEYIIMNSKLLNTMTIKSRNQIDENEKHQMLVKLSSYPRGSTACKLLFH